MAKLETILDEWKQDSVIDETELSKESLNIPLLSHKYLRWFTEERLKYQSLMRRKKEMTKLKSLYYNGILSEEELKANNWEPCQQRILKTDIPMWIEADTDLLELNDKITLCEEKIALLDKIMKFISARNFTISNALTYLKFVHGK